MRFKEEKLPEERKVQTDVELAHQVAQLHLGSRSGDLAILKKEW